MDVGSVPHRHGDAEAHEEEVDEDDPDAGIEVDVYEGSSIKRKVGVLKKDANSITHLLTHRYRNPFCESCVKAKMRHFRSRTGAFKREVKTFGDLVTFDFVTASGDHEVEGRYALIIRDIYTGIIMAYPTARRDTDSVVRAIKHFCGRRKIKQVYSDDGPELINACVELKLNHDPIAAWGGRRTIPLLKEQINSSLTRLRLSSTCRSTHVLLGCRPSPLCAIS